MSSCPCRRTGRLCRACRLGLRTDEFLAALVPWAVAGLVIATVAGFLSMGRLH